VPTQRRIEYSDEFNAACEQFGGIKAVDALIAGLVEALDRDPDKFFVLDQEHGLRYARVKRGEGQCDLVAIFEVDADRDVIFRGLRELTRPVYNA
jgi:hypothetical protein